MGGGTESDSVDGGYNYPAQNPDVPENPGESEGDGNKPTEPEKPETPNPEPEKPKTITELLSIIISDYDSIPLETITVTPEALKAVGDVWSQLEIAAQAGTAELISSTEKSKIIEYKTLFKSQDKKIVAIEKDGSQYSFKSELEMGLVFTGTFYTKEISVTFGEAVIANMGEATFIAPDALTVILVLQKALNIQAVSKYNSNWLPTLSNE